MLEILVIIAVVKAFTRKAGEKNLNKTLWGIIGAASYYVPILLASLVVLPYLVGNGYMDYDDTTSMKFKLIAINLVVGIACCFLAYQVLKNTKAIPDTVDSDIIDSNLDS
mgnify:CR=1 FL=1